MALMTMLNGRAVTCEYVEFVEWCRLRAKWRAEGVLEQRERELHEVFGELCAAVGLEE